MLLLLLLDDFLLSGCISTSPSAKGLSENGWDRLTFELEPFLSELFFEIEADLADFFDRCDPISCSESDSLYRLF